MVTTCAQYCLFSGHNIGLWDAEEQLLPVEIGDYIIEIEDVGLCIIGVNKTKEIVVIHKKTQEDSMIICRLTGN
ncbi:hypothetical protein H7U18_22585 [Klebsiella pneumoniae]|uniref:Uncharacterized protein n=1 Tax=Klebsiella pneumoniae TaxID=573 RepID=A0A923EQ88_KLEPN|nr:hypothetical protein [Klebsiella pneumoniae]